MVSLPSKSMHSFSSNLMRAVHGSAGILFDGPREQVRLDAGIECHRRPAARLRERGIRRGVERVGRTPRLRDPRVEISLCCCPHVKLLIWKTVAAELHIAPDKLGRPGSEKIEIGAHARHSVNLPAE